MAKLVRDYANDQSQEKDAKKQQVTAVVSLVERRYADYDDGKKCTSL